MRRYGGSAIRLRLLMPHCYHWSPSSAESEPLVTDRFMLLLTWLACALS